MTERVINLEDDYWKLVDEICTKMRFQNDQQMFQTLINLYVQAVAVTDPTNRRVVLFGGDKKNSERCAHCQRPLELYKRQALLNLGYEE